MLHCCFDSSLHLDIPVGRNRGPHSQIRTSSTRFDKCMYKYRLRACSCSTNIAGSPIHQLFNYCQLLPVRFSTWMKFNLFCTGFFDLFRFTCLLAALDMGLFLDQFGLLDLPPQMCRKPDSDTTHLTHDVETQQTQSTFDHKVVKGQEHRTKWRFLSQMPGICDPVTCPRLFRLDSTISSKDTRATATFAHCLGTMSLV